MQKLATAAGTGISRGHLPSCFIIGKPQNVQNESQNSFLQSLPLGKRSAPRSPPPFQRFQPYQPMIASQIPRSGRTIMVKRRVACFGTPLRGLLSFPKAIATQNNIREPRIMRHAGDRRP
ncbi:hypothetical protein TWF506_000864 [Arthrobotrys conoides]|uniref:Uncharacterized protein n=1 Tax=Arthrobotrys conoides TaxID=74498 RepID=A0AAN8NGD8_9PEZI